MVALMLTAAPSEANLSPWPLAPRLLVEDSITWSCSPRKTCPKIGSCEEAKWYLANCAWGYRLDADSDESPCEQLCGQSTAEAPRHK
jgi:hypothetical protein